MRNIFYNAQHSPMGAFASFTLGQKGGHGGLGLQQGRPADEPIYLGLESRDNPNRFEAMPFFETDPGNSAANFVSDSEASPQLDDHHLGEVPGVTIEPFPDHAIQRQMTLSRDEWTAGDLTFRIVSPVFEIPDPEADLPDHGALKRATCPAVLIEIEVDNTDCDHDRRAYFGFAGSDPYTAMRQLDDHAFPGLTGLAQGRRKGLFTQTPGAAVAQAFSLESVLRPTHPANHRFILGPVGAITCDAPAGQRSTFRFAVAFFVDDVVTSGEDAVYFYTRYFDRVEAVADYALSNFDAYLQLADAADQTLADATHLNEAQRWQLAQTVHSYYGSTQLLDLGRGRPLSHDGRKPCWVVNEGEYRMMNTFDLTVDMIFFELRMNPWAVRNVLDRFIDRYSYTDTLHFPGGDNDHPGGITFAHDQGVTNHFTPPGQSSYEMTRLHGCFSYMSCEQLTNFVCCVATYDHHTADHAWTARHADLLSDCLDSLINRDHPDDAQRNGIMGLDSSRTGDGSEITTYDSLDTSLGQARNNVYLGVKSWASYVLLEKLLARLGHADQAARANTQAHRAAATIASQADDQGRIPAVLFEDNQAFIIPAVEGLVFPFVAGAPEAIADDGPYAALIAALRQHLDAVLQPGACLFDDHGWKLSTTSINSWLSKIYLCQFVVRHVLKQQTAAQLADADAAHEGWLKRDENAYWAWSDQMHAGRAMGSKYYPRGVTAALWLTES